MPLRAVSTSPGFIARCAREVLGHRRDRRDLARAGPGGCAIETAASTLGGAGHVGLHRHHALVGLEREAARVEGDRPCRRAPRGAAPRRAPGRRSRSTRRGGWTRALGDAAQPAEALLGDARRRARPRRSTWGSPSRRSRAALARRLGVMSAAGRSTRPLGPVDAAPAITSPRRTPSLTRVVHRARSAAGRRAGTTSKRRVGVPALKRYDARSAPSTTAPGPRAAGSSRPSVGSRKATSPLARGARRRRAGQAVDLGVVERRPPTPTSATLSPANARTTVELPGRSPRAPAGRTRPRRSAAGASARR